MHYLLIWFGSRLDIWGYDGQYGYENVLMKWLLYVFLVGCQIFAYDHTIDAPPTRGKNIKYFKTGLGFGENLKPLSQLIEENEHQTTEIDYLKVR